MEVRQRGRGGAAGCRAGWVEDFGKWGPGSREFLGRREILGKWELTVLLRRGSVGLGEAHPTEQEAAPRLLLLSVLAPCFLPRLLVLSAPFLLWPLP